MNASRLQHIISSSVVLGVALIVTWLSFTEKPADAFLFPRLISIFFCGLAVWNFIRAAGGMAKVGEGIDPKTFKNMLPGLGVILVYVFFAARGLGFYASSAITFLILYSIYDPVSITNGRAWMKRLVVTVIFMAVIYCLFALLLKVQTPRGIFF